MKYVIFLGDGMADFPIAEFGGKTPLQAAVKPNIDGLAKQGIVGLVKTVPEHYKNPGSDVANMSVMGYNPDSYYTGRAPLEAVGMDIAMSDTDVAVRCSLVTLSDEPAYEDKTMVDYSSGEITTEESRVLIEYLHEKIGGGPFTFLPGVSYRHCLMWDQGKISLGCTAPHDILDRRVGEYLPSSPDAKNLIEMMKQSYELLKDHPINKARIARGLNPGNSIWLWGEGTKPGLSSFEEKYGIKGAVITAVDLLKGIAKCAEMEVINVPGATGRIDTDFSGKAMAAVDFLSSGGDFVYIHVEAPDECGHHNEVEEKKRSIELIDEKIVKPVMDYLVAQGDYRVMVLPDHPTPLSLRTHTNDPVPYLMAGSGVPASGDEATYDEVYGKACKENYVNPGYGLMDRFLGK